jgi:rhamnogalacturonan endolyase
MVSNHHGEGVPNITAGFDRTFGPAYLHFNKGFATLDASLADANKLSSVNWNAAFYDSIAPQVPGYIPTKNRGIFTATITLPAGAKNPIAVLSANGETFQDNSRNPKALQYWGEINSSGQVTIPRVKADTYRVTVYADGIFGEMIHDGVQIRAGQTTTRSWVWTPEANGTEIWRLGTPDKSAGEFRHGNTPDANHPLHFPGKQKAPFFLPSQQPKER